MEIDVQIDGRVYRQINLSVYLHLSNLFIYLSIDHSLRLSLPPSLTLLSLSFSLSLPLYLSNKNGVYEKEDVEHNLTYLLLELKEPSP